MARESILPVFVPHEGCPCQCVFCNQRAITGLEDAQAQAALEAGFARLGKTARPQIAFYGGSFTAIRPERQEALLKLAHSYIESGRALSIRVSTRPDAIDKESLARLKRYGVTVIELGAQSMSDEILKRAKRGHTAQDIVTASAAVKAAGFQLILQAMAGLPGETRDTARRTARLLSQLKPDGARIYPVVVLPGTELFAMWQRGEYKALTVPAAAVLCADMLEEFLKQQIPVLRIGLNPTGELGEQAAAGAYHPAMGELCWNEWYLRRMEKALAHFEGTAGTAVFQVPKGSYSKAAGQKKKNLLELKKRFPLVKVVLREAAEEAFSFIPQ